MVRADHGTSPHTGVRAAREVNTTQPRTVVTKARAEMARLQSPTIACFGLSYKADIDDLRESPAIEIALRLAQEGNGPILAVEPHIDRLPTPLTAAGVELCEVKKALAEADILLGLVPHTAFRKLPCQALQEKILIDTCRVWG